MGARVSSGSLFRMTVASSSSERATKTAPGRRLVNVNELDISGISDDGKCVPVLADEDGFVALDVQAESGTHAHPGVSMVGWDGGSDLVVLAPGLACSVPWGDELDSGDNQVSSLTSRSRARQKEIADAIANWLTNITFDFWAALVLEPLDPDGTLDDQGRDVWAEFEDRMLTTNPVLRVPEGIEPLLRAALTRLSICDELTSFSASRPVRFAVWAMPRRRWRGGSR